MKKLSLTLSLLLMLLVCYGQDNQEVSEESNEIGKETVKEPTEEEPIIIKYYQTTEPEEEVSIESSSLVYYGEDSNETFDDEDEYIVEPEKPAKQEPQEKKKENDRVRTLYSGKSHNGGYGSIGFKGTEQDDDAMLMAGIRGGWIINRSIVIGIDVWGVIPTIEYGNKYNIPTQNSVALLGGYGGLLLEPIMFSNEVVHLTFPVSTGAGWLGLQEYNDEYTAGNEENLLADDVFWYIEPGAALEINIASFMRVNFGASKTFTQGLDINTIPGASKIEVFDNWNYFVMLKFGGF